MRRSRLVHLDAVALVDIDKPAVIPGMEVVGLHKVELLQAEFLQPHDHAFVELRIGARAPVLLMRPVLAADAAHIRLQYDPVTYRDPALFLGHEDLARQSQAFAELRLLVHFVRHFRAPDKHRLRILLDKRVEAEERPAGCAMAAQPED